MVGDIEDVKHAIAVRLAAAAFLTALSAVDVEKGQPASTTPGPSAIYEGEKANLAGVGFPVCEVIGHRTRYGEDDQQTKFAMHEVEVTWTQVGDDELLIATQLQRLARATRDLFWPSTGPIPLPEVSSAPLVFVSEEYTALMPAQEHPFVKAVATQLQVPTLCT